MAIVKTTVLALDKRINGTINAVEKHIENSRGRNIAIGTAFVTIVLFLLGASYKMGGTKKQVDINTARWVQLMELETGIK
jgi:hypothetical protein